MEGVAVPGVLRYNGDWGCILVIKVLLVRGYIEFVSRLLSFPYRSSIVRALKPNVNKRRTVR